ncbi:MAG TPA: SUMF1/EgtB/PvdO family nonheme iron enzyme [Flavobacteriales bacterium]|nr:SUMF1/EgtB/PvdO family nonheme iron enzyme [Flavobacteriales bacterium]
MRSGHTYLFWIFSLQFSLGLVGCGQTKKTNGNEIPEGFVNIPAGEYELGEKGHYVNPHHKTKTPGFYISATEITNKQFEAFTKATGYKTTAERFHNAMTFYVGLDEFEWYNDTTANWQYPFGIKNEGIKNKMDHPVTCISFLDIKKYCEWAKVRLPTLDEWEIACRAGTEGKHFFKGDSTHVPEYANIWLSRRHSEANVHDDYLFTSPVKKFKPNAWGLYDMYGNCFEFCADRAKPYKDKKNLACARGGSWWCSKNSCNFFNSVDIGRVDQFASFSNQGFRVVLDLK